MYRWLALVVVLCPRPAWCQPRLPAFEVASVKRSRPDSVPAGWRDSPEANNVRLQGRDHGHYRMYDTSLRILLQLAYRLTGDRLSGPGWMDTEGYDVDARMPANTPDEQVRLMLQSLLTERFQLKVQRQQKETAVYVLLVGSKGPKLKPATEGAPPTVRMGPAAMFATNRSMRDLASLLGRWTDRPVVDMTGLSGFYDFELKWGDPADSRGSIAALSSLGLKTEARKVNLEYMTVVSALKTPVAN